MQRILWANPRGANYKNYTRPATTILNELKAKSTSENLSPPLLFLLAYEELSQHRKFAILMDNGFSDTNVEVNKSKSGDTVSSRCTGATKKTWKKSPALVILLGSAVWKNQHGRSRKEVVKIHRRGGDSATKQERSPRSPSWDGDNYS